MTSAGSGPEMPGFPAGRIGNSLACCRSRVQRKWQAKTRRAGLDRMPVNGKESSPGPFAASGGGSAGRGYRDESRPATRGGRAGDFETPARRIAIRFGLRVVSREACGPLVFGTVPGSPSGRPEDADFSPALSNTRAGNSSISASSKESRGRITLRKKGVLPSCSGEPAAAPCRDTCNSGWARSPRKTLRWWPSPPQLPRQGIFIPARAGR
jgi:hypothetical protein